MKVGGRWSEEAWNFVALLAEAKAKLAPKALQRSSQYCLLRRWTQMVSVAAMSAFAATQLEESTGTTPLYNDVLPDWGDVLCDREVVADGPSKLL